MLMLMPPFLMLLPLLISPINKHHKTANYLFILSFYSFFFIYSPMTDISFSSQFFTLTPLNSTLMALSFWISSLMILASAKTFFKSLNPMNLTLSISILCLILIISFSLNNLLSFYIMFEASLIPTLFLILGWGYQPERLQATFYLTLYTICASLPLLMGISFIFSNFGTMSLWLPMMTPLFNYSLSSSIWWLSLLLAFLVKMPMYFTHLWLPKAHVEAPVSGSMILAGLLLKLGGYGILQLSPFFQPLSFSLGSMLTAIAMWGGSLTSLMCIRQPDMKSLIAYSSIGHMAFVIMGIMLCTSWGWQGAMTMMIAHGLCSSCLFAMSNYSYETTSTRSLILNKGILSISPAFSFWWFIMCIFNMAAPPSINLFSEIILITSGIWFNLYISVPIALCSFLACSYSLILFSSSNHGTIPSFLNPQNPLSTSSYLLFFLHAIPLVFMIFKPELISSWI